MEGHGLRWFYRRLRRVRPPWDGLLLVGIVAGLFGGAVLGAWIVVQAQSSPLLLMLGLPMLVVSAAIASHLVPRRIAEPTDGA